MTGLSMVLVLLLGQAPDRGAGELVGRLGSSRYDEREAAAAALEKMGLDALPALRDGRESKDPELRNRSEALIARIRRREQDRAEAEGTRIGRPELKDASPIRLDVANRPLDEVIEGFGSPSPSRLAWHPDTPESVLRRRVTIREPGPLPFWAAIDRVCKAGDLRYIPGSPGGPGDHRTPEHRLFLAPGAWNGTRADSGPFRLEFVRIDHSRRINLIPNSQRREQIHMGPRRRRFGEREEEFRMELRILAEPRMLIDQVGSALIAEAVDDRGQSLLPGPAPHLHHYGYRFGGQPQACGPYFLDLKHPDRAGKVIKRLKLTIPVEVMTPEPDRLEIKLADAMGKTIRHGQTSIKVIAVGADSQGHQRVKLLLGSDQVAPERLTPGPDGQLAPAESRPAQPEITPNVIQVLDQQGRQFPWLVESTRATGPEVTAELMMWPEGGIEIPVRAGRGVVPGGDRATAVPSVLYHTGAARGVISATFEFHDIPLP